MISGGWQQYSYAEDGFSIAALSTPEFQKVSQEGLDNHNYNISLAGDRSFLISVTDTKQGDKLEPKRTLPTAKDSFAKKAKPENHFRKNSQAGRALRNRI